MNDNLNLPLNEEEKIDAQPTVSEDIEVQKEAEYQEFMQTLADINAELLAEEEQNQKSEEKVEITEEPVNLITGEESKNEIAQEPKEEKELPKRKNSTSQPKKKRSSIRRTAYKSFSLK